jgi:5-methylcytosine-specific restriction enzyme subunit McrC
MLASKRLGLFEQGRVACRFEELTMNTPRNCYVRGALSHLAGLVADPELRKHCRILAARLEQMGVTGPVPVRAQIATERFGRHDREDSRLIAAARLAFDLQIPTEQAGRQVLVRPDRDEHWLRKLFEKAVSGFYAVALAPHGWQVRAGGQQRWPVAAASSGIKDVLPSMFTDIVLENAEQQRRIVIDTKFARILTRGRADRERLKSGYLYQIYAYLRTQECEGDPLSKRAEGMLLHPAVGEDLDEWAEVQGHLLRFSTVDLAATTAEIREQLLARVRP